MYYTPINSNDVTVVESTFAVTEVQSIDNLNYRAYLPNVSTGTIPLVMFHHGWSASMRKYRPLMFRLSRSGYGCIVPDYPDSALSSDGPTQAEFGLYKFRLDAAKQLQTQAPSILRKEIGNTYVGGHSFGADTAMQACGMTFTQSGVTQTNVVSGLTAGFCLSPQGTEGTRVQTGAWSSMYTPVLHMTGTNDPGRLGDDYTWRLEPFLGWGGNNVPTMVTVLQSGDHGFGTVTEADNVVPNDRQKRLSLDTINAWLDFWEYDSFEANTYLNMILPRHPLLTQWNRKEG